MMASAPSFPPSSSESSHADDASGSSGGSSADSRRCCPLGRILFRRKKLSDVAAAASSPECSASSVRVSSPACKAGSFSRGAAMSPRTTARNSLYPLSAVPGVEDATGDRGTGGGGGSGSSVTSSVETSMTMGGSSHGGDDDDDPSRRRRRSARRRAAADGDAGPVADPSLGDTRTSLGPSPTQILLPKPRSCLVCRCRRCSALLPSIRLLLSSLVSLFLTRRLPRDIRRGVTTTGGLSGRCPRDRSGGSIGLNNVSLELPFRRFGHGAAPGDANAPAASAALLLGERSREESNVVSIAEVAGVSGSLTEDGLIGENAELDPEPIRASDLGLLLEVSGGDLDWVEGGGGSNMGILPPPLPSLRRGSPLLWSGDFPPVSTRSTFSSRLSLGSDLPRMGVEYWDSADRRGDDLARAGILFLGGDDGFRAGDDELRR
mmetsp:Transcript_40420/g.86059  ORF Transcript_40420/g.86059 Transcript_40420/m.86059 type:complete len:434 (-) Transcript_40420:233-1534(-)